MDELIIVGVRKVETKPETNSTVLFPEPVDPIMLKERVRKMSDQGGVQVVYSRNDNVGLIQCLFLHDVRPQNIEIRYFLVSSSLALSSWDEYETFPLRSRDVIIRTIHR